MKKAKPNPAREFYKIETSILQELKNLRIINLIGGNQMQNRFKSLVLWTSIVAQVVVIGLLTHLFNIGLGDTINAVASAVLQLLVLLGILNNPTNPNAL